MLVKCLNCNIDYESPVLENSGRRSTFFCSENCLNLWNESKNNKTNTCKACGKSFKTLRRMNGCYDESSLCPECVNKDLVQCQYCGKYYPKITNEKGKRITYYCSEECNIKWNKEKNTKTRICKYCGKIFTVPRYMDNFYSETIYCSHECMLLGQQEISKEEEKPTICKNCGKPFYQKRIREIHRKGFEYYRKESKRYCSEECYKEACQFSYNFIAERVCQCCGKTFIARQYTEDDEVTKQDPRLLGLYKRGITCSYECSRKLRGKRYKKTCLERYGVTSCAKLEENKEKSKQTCLERYGVAYGIFTENALKANILGNNSKVNSDFADLLKKLNINFKQEFALDEYLFDFYLQDSNIVIELNPSFTHTTIDSSAYFGKDKNYHLDKTQIAVQNGYRCINIWDWDDKFKIAVSCKAKQKLYARKLQLKGINKQEANSFLNEYHFQNSCYGNEINLGLFNNDELIQVMTFGKPRYNKNYQWELLRLCTKFEYYVIGGAEKLFKHFIKEYNPQSIISYCDISKFTGDVYEKLGFKLLRQTSPQKIWNKKNSTQFITDNLLRQHGFDKLVGSKLDPPEIYGKGTDNEKLMLEHSWLPVYDCGQKVFIYDN